MDTLANLRKRALKLKPKAIADGSGLSKAYVTELLKGDKTNPSLDAFQRLEKAVTRLESEAAKQATKTKSSGKTAKKQTPSRDKRAAAVAPIKP